MSAADWAPAIAAALLQWWLWSSLLASALLLLAVVLKERRAAWLDGLFRACLALEVCLLAISIALSFARQGASGPPAALPGRLDAALDLQRLAALPLEGAAAALDVAARSPAEGATPVPKAWRPFRLEVIGPTWAFAAGLAMFAAGFLAGSLRLSRELVVLSRLRRGSPLAGESDLTCACARAARRLGLKRPVELRLTPFVAAPLLTGWRRPAILFPGGLQASLGAEEAESLLAHELAHAQRHDLAWNLLQRVLILCAWPLPFQRWLSRPMRQAAELLCDQMAAGERGSRDRYARALLKVLEFSQKLRDHPASVAAVSSASFVERRLQMLLEQRLSPAPWRGARRLLSVSMAVLAALPLLALEVAGRPERPAIDLSDSPSSADEAPPPEDVRKARENLASLYLEAAIREYGAAHHDTARKHLRWVHRLGGLGPEVRSLTGEVGVLAVPVGFASSAFVSWVIEKRVGKLETARPGYWADLEADGFLVQEKPLLERIRRELLPPEDPERLVYVECRFLRLTPAAAGEWCAALRQDSRGEDWSHALDAESATRLRRALEAQPEAMKVEASPCATLIERQPAQILVAHQRAFIEKFKLVSNGPVKVLDPQVGVLTEGSKADILALLDKDSQVRLFLRPTSVKQKLSELVTISIPPYADKVPIEIPVLEEEARNHEVLIPPGEGVLLGRGPTAAEREHGHELAWLWVKAEVKKR